MMSETKWDFDAGLLPLDFANTAEWHASPQPDDRLLNYELLIDWSMQAGLLSTKVANTLLEIAKSSPMEAEQTLRHAIEVRETIYRLFSSTANQKTPSPEDLQILNQALSQAMSHLRIINTQDRFAYAWSVGDDGLGRMLWPILQSTAELLTSTDLKRIGECADDRGCGYLFFDTSRNHSRRWCSMESCGNRAKAQRHYQRSKEQDHA
jgi:predicted RNA-binding Zn ribbon-like protein